eukprot:g6006.t1
MSCRLLCYVMSTIVECHVDYCAMSCPLLWNVILTIVLCHVHYCGISVLSGSVTPASMTRQFFRHEPGESELQTPRGLVSVLATPVGVPRYRLETDMLVNSPLPVSPAAALSPGDTKSFVLHSKFGNLKRGTLPSWSLDGKSGNNSSSSSTSRKSIGRATSVDAGTTSPTTSRVPARTPRRTFSRLLSRGISKKTIEEASSTSTGPGAVPSSVASPRGSGSAHNPYTPTPRVHPSAFQFGRPSQTSSQEKTAKETDGDGVPAGFARSDQIPSREGSNSNNKDKHAGGGGDTTTPRSQTMSTTHTPTISPTGPPGGPPPEGLGQASYFSPGHDDAITSSGKAIAVLLRLRSSAYSRLRAQDGAYHSESCTSLLAGNALFTAPDACAVGRIPYAWTQILDGTAVRRVSGQTKWPEAPHLKRSLQKSCDE